MTFLGLYAFMSAIVYIVLLFNPAFGCHTQTKRIVLYCIANNTKFKKTIRQIQLQRDRSTKEYQDQL